jgi:hypothetical protein
MRQKGLTIIQLMLILVIAGVAGTYVVDVVIEKRCASSSAKLHCETRANAPK